jgi:hypothetical protein
MRVPPPCRNLVAIRELIALVATICFGPKQMFAWWKLWIDALELGLEAQRVIELRVAKIAAGGVRAEAESRRMVSEKFAAAAAARKVAAAALAKGKGIDTAAMLALVPVRRTVRANHRRLLRAERFRVLRTRVRCLLGRAGPVIGRMFKHQP